MQIGLFSNGERHNQIAKTTYDEDLAEVVLADELGLQEAWISEHGTFIRYHAPDQLPCAELFICKAAVLTKQIRMGPGIRPLPYYLVCRHRCCRLRPFDTAVIWLASVSDSAARHATRSSAR
jgi:hypothetical protein